MKKIAILSLSLSFVLFNVFLSSKAYSQSSQTFTNSGNFTPAAGVNTLTAEAWGGGGGGGTKSSGNGGGGGGGGAYARTNNIPVTQGVSYPFVVGAGGNANTSGGFSSFNVNTIRAAGGSGVAINSSTGANGGTIANSIGTTRHPGGNGGNGGYVWVYWLWDYYYSGGGGGGGGSIDPGTNASGESPGNGGTANGGDGASGVRDNNTGNPGGNYGGGGSGGVNRSGGSGANGLVKLNYTCPNYSLTSTTITSTTCSGSPSTVTLKGSVTSLPIGTYTVTYDISNPNSATNITSTMTVTTAGTGTFTTSSLANTGSTTITVKNLKSGSGTGCSSTISTNHTASVTVNTLPTITGTTPGSRSGNGTVILGITGSAGTLNLYANASGGSSLASSTTTNIETPSISSTKTYYVSTTNSCGTSTRVPIVATVKQPEIDVKGNSNSIIGNNTNIPKSNDNTDFGTAQLVSETITKTFVINNTGPGDLTLLSTSLSGSGSADFTLISAPTSGTIIAPGATANIVISFKALTNGIKNTVLTIASSDQDEASYRINLRGEGKKIFYDSDGDGIYDDADIDDDNDGISDSSEEMACRLSGGASLANYKFLNETFGSGTTRTTINTTYDATTTYCYENGTGTAACNIGGNDLQDGEYTVHNNISNLADWAPSTWYTGSDHTGNPNGRMALFNAANDPGIFYTARITGALPGVPITYSFWALNLDTQTTGGIATRTRPNIKVEFRDVNGNVLETISTGDIPPSINGNPGASWHNFAADLTFNVSEFYVYFINNNGGGLGNDLAIDDIVISQTLCDSDGDGIGNIFDLDSDNDGIPDMLEAYPEKTALSLGKDNLTGIVGWIDANANGMDDRFESFVPMDTDNDGVPDYLDLDSDNDGLLDVDESGTRNANDLLFENGDGDITGDGVGDGLETETFREKDSNGDGIVEGYGDGILDIYDFHEGNTSFANSYGNSGQSILRDSDGDGIADYRDPFNNTTGIYDIDTVEIYKHLPNTNGILNSTIDADGDGIMASRDGDDTVIGSPRNLNASYSLYFDGRNDYVEDANSIPSGSATLMAFIKSGGANTNNNYRIIAGQSDFNIRVNTNSTITAVAEGVTITSTSKALLGIWMHVAVTTTSGSTILYINGVEEARNNNGGISSTSKFMIGRATTNNNYFKGEIDEVRLFNKALSSEELKRMVYQELDDTNGFNQGKIIPLGISASLGTNLVKYYKMDAYKDDILDNKKTPVIDGNGAKMFNFKDIYFQKAPLPYVTKADGNWTDNASWLYGNEWDITTKQNKTDDASIVHIKHNINLNGTYNTQGTVGIIVDAGKEFSITADKGLYNSWYLKLNGVIDLDNESQLIQTANSVLDVTSAGILERDQQGTRDYFTYNYWSSPVGRSNATTNNNSYSLPNVLKDGSVATAPATINFLTSGYNGNPGTPGATPISIADYWIWKYSNKTSNTYSQWQHVRRSGTLLAGEGFSMKGVANTNGSIALQQNYVFNGKPNNGNIMLPISSGNDYLVGNPYPSALDAHEFILDNIKDGSGRAATNIINGALYFWDHFASSTHVLAEYQGGYATYTLMGGTAAISNDSRINATGAVGTKIPERYIPVSQGFFVSAILDASLVNDGLTSAIVGGTITFKNSQRTFITEGSGNSLFLKPNKTSKSDTNLKSDVDPREKIRLMFDSPKGYHRQLLAGVDENTSNGFDIGYDAPLIEANKEDMFWVFSKNNFVIQAVNNFNNQQILPLGVKINKAGTAKIKIDELENITDLEIYLVDKDLQISHDLKKSNYEVYLLPGEYLNRFEIAFSNAKNASLGTDIIENESIQVYFSNEKESIIIENPVLKQVKSVELINILGQSIYKFNTLNNADYMEYETKQLSTGTYIIKIQTEAGSFSKKVLIQ